MVFFLENKHTSGRSVRHRDIHDVRSALPFPIRPLQQPTILRRQDVRVPAHFINGLHAPQPPSTLRPGPAPMCPILRAT